MSHLTRPFRRLQWKLTLSHTFTTITALLLLEFLAFAGIYLLFLNLPPLLLDGTQQKAHAVTAYFRHGTANRAAVSKWLQDSFATRAPLLSPALANALAGYQDSFMAVIDTRGQVIASTGGKAVAPNSAIQQQLSSGENELLQAVMQGRKGTAGTVIREDSGMIITAVPINETAGQIDGVVLLLTRPPDLPHLFTNFALPILPLSLIFIVMAGIVGTIFGALTSRGFTSRFSRLTATTDNWSQGDFSSFAYDPSDDELGQFTRRLNRMAEQLQNLLHARQKLAALEERSRLARDLHDSVKQQVFNISMQIGAAKLLVDRDSAATKKRLNEVEQLIRQIQQELTSLLQELRPLALEGKDLGKALRNLATDWSRQTGIDITCEITDDTSLSLKIEEALYRLTQEALANVARHSQATTVKLQLQRTPETLTLTLMDNGQGFEPVSKEGSGIGLRSMRERTQAVGGKFQIESVSKQGTRIQVDIPTDR